MHRCSDTENTVYFCEHFKDDVLGVLVIRDLKFILRLRQKIGAEHRTRFMETDPSAKLLCLI